MSTIDSFQQVLKLTKLSLPKTIGLQDPVYRRCLSQKTELLTNAEVEGKDVEGRKRLRTSPYEYLNDCVQIWFKQMLGKNVPVNGETLKIKAIHIHWLIE